MALIDKAAEDLRDQLAAFRDGWTAPPAKRWIERHPALYAVALLVIGLLVGQIPQGITWLKSLRGAPPAITQASPHNPPDAKSEARLNALLKIYRDGQKPVTPDNIRDYMDRVEKAHIAEGVLAKEYQDDLYIEQEREARAAAAHQEEQVDEMIANASK